MPGVGAFDSLFCPEGRVFVHNDCLGEMAMDEIDTCIMVCDQNFYGGKGWWIGRGVAVKDA